MPSLGKWTLRCDCGWEGRTAQHDGIRVRGRQEVDDELEGAFLGHLGPDERRTYLLVDGGQAATEVMPEGLPARLITWWEEDDVRYGRAELESGEVLVLPVGEVRTIDHKVYRLDE